MGDMSDAGKRGWETRQGGASATQERKLGEIRNDKADAATSKAVGASKHANDLAATVADAHKQAHDAHKEAAAAHTHAGNADKAAAHEDAAAGHKDAFGKLNGAVVPKKAAKPAAPPASPPAALPGPPSLPGFGKKAVSPSDQKAVAQKAISRLNLAK
jgi:hypothetical protein